MSRAAVRYRAANGVKAREQRGFTLIELMVVVVIAGLLAAIAVPMFEEGLQRNRNLAALESMLAMIASGRSEAVARSTTVTLCPSNDGGVSCSGTDWERGAILFEDNGAGNSADRNLDANEEVIRIFGPAGAGVTITSIVATGSFTNDDGIVFDRLGGVEEAGSLAICDGRGLEWARALVLNVSGQARLATDDDDDDIVNIGDDSGRNLQSGDCQ